MLRGRFGNTSGRPYLEGRLLFPRLKVHADISWLVDTGADRTLLMPDDGLRMGLDYAKLTGDVETIGVGGVTHNFIEPAALVFHEPPQYLHIYLVEVEIASPTPDIRGVPSLLGRDVMDRWRMTYDPSKKRIQFKVHSADQTIDLLASRSAARPTS